MDAENFHKNNNTSLEGNDDAKDTVNTDSNAPEASVDTEPTSETQAPAPTTSNTAETSGAPAPAPAPTAPGVTPAPAAATPPQNTATQQQNSAGTLILQWLSYAFWGWFVIALIWIIAAILASAILNTSMTYALPYILAAVIILLPTAIVTDSLYTKREPARKTGAAIAIVSIHVVLYALLSIGALITAVFTALSILTTSTNNTGGETVAIFSSLSAALLYAGVIVRIIGPAKIKRIALIFRYTILAITLALLVAAAVGPFAQSLVAKQDYDVENNLSGIDNAINSYLTKNKKLPASLNDLTTSSSDVTALIKSGKVTYTPSKTTTKDYSSSSSSSSSYYYDSETVYSYQLCATYKAPKGSSRDQESAKNSKYSINTNAHPSGNVCYDRSETLSSY